MAEVKKKVYLAVRKKNPNLVLDPFSGYLNDKQYLDKKAGVYLNNEKITA